MPCSKGAPFYTDSVCNRKATCWRSDDPDAEPSNGKGAKLVFLVSVHGRYGACNQSLVFTSCITMMRASLCSSLYASSTRILLPTSSGAGQTGLKYITDGSQTIMDCMMDVNT